MMYECCKCGEFKQFNEDPNCDPLDICPQCRVNYGWISEDNQEFTDFLDTINDGNVF